MDRIKNPFQSEPLYERIVDHDEAAPDEPFGQPLDERVTVQEPREEEDGPLFSWIEYSVFLLLGIAMLWAWYGTQGSIETYDTG